MSITFRRIDFLNRTSLSHNAQRRSHGTPQRRNQIPRHPQNDISPSSRRKPTLQRTGGRVSHAPRGKCPKDKGGATWRTAPSPFAERKGTRSEANAGVCPGRTLGPQTTNTPTLRTTPKPLILPLPSVGEGQGEGDRGGRRAGPAPSKPPSPPPPPKPPTTKSHQSQKSA